MLAVAARAAGSHHEIDLQAAKREGLTFDYRIMNDEQHATIYHRAALEALRVVFANPPEQKS